MQIHQVSANHVVEEDRILLRINTTDGQEFRAWLTRRMTGALWPALHHTLTELLLRMDARLAVGDESDPLKRSMLADFQRDSLLGSSDFSRPFRTDSVNLPLGEHPLLVTDVQVSQPREHVVRLDFSDKLAAQAGGAAVSPRSFSVDLDAPLMQGMMHLIDQAVLKADWQLPAPEALRSREAASPAARVLN
ncbi:MAG: hypothetical protein EBU07_12795 [Betaproteobacteria bacterium]|nr:hypothetical protein [Betaproteobacteria bacterium]NBS47129.1 hypothetical protein [Betaproteobacteria bacterium]